jgi:hypothetical protein
LVADAVAVERVSTLGFPANREKNREFCKIGASGASETVNSAAITGLLTQIPYSTEQGIISAEQGILAQEQGILLALFFGPFSHNAWSNKARSGQGQVGIVLFIVLDRTVGVYRFLAGRD